MNPIEDRIAALERGLADTKINFLELISENNRRLATLNTVAVDQMSSIRDLNHNETILTGVVGEQGRDIKAIRGDISEIKADISNIQSDISSIKDRLERFDGQFAFIQQQLAALAVILQESEN